MRIADVGLSTARVYGELFADLRARGRPVPTNDLWIAATAISEGAKLITFDTDFERVGALRVERLRP